MSTTFRSALAVSVMVPSEYAAVIKTSPKTFASSELPVTKAIESLEEVIEAEDVTSAVEVSE